MSKGLKGASETSIFLAKAFMEGRYTCNIRDKAALKIRQRGGAGTFVLNGHLRRKRELFLRLKRGDPRMDRGQPPTAQNSQLTC